MRTGRIEAERSGGRTIRRAFRLACGLHTCSSAASCESTGAGTALPYPTLGPALTYPLHSKPGEAGRRVNVEERDHRHSEPNSPQNIDVTCSSQCTQHTLLCSPQLACTTSGLCTFVHLSQVDHPHRYQYVVPQLDAEEKHVSLVWYGMVGMAGRG